MTPSGRYLGAISTFLAVLAYACLWIWQGLDFSDEGFYLTHHWLVVSDSPRYTYGMRWLSDRIGAGWLSLTGDPGLLVARLGWAEVMAMTGLVAYVALVRHFPSWPTGWLVVSTAIAIGYYDIMAIQADNVGAGLLVAASGCLVASQAAGRSDRSRLLAAAAAGMLFGLAYFARFPLLLAIPLPLLLPAATRLLRQPNSPSWRFAAVSLLATLATLLAGGGWLRSQGRLDEYLAAITSTDLNESYALTALLVDYLRDAAFAGAYLAVAIALLSVLMVVARRIAARYTLSSRQSAAVATLLLLALVSMLTVGIGVTRAMIIYRLLMPAAVWAAGLVCLLSLYVFDRDGASGRSPSHLHLLVVGLFLTPLMAAGSVTGLIKTKFGLWLLLPVVVMLLPESLALVVGKRQRGTVEAANLRPYVIGVTCVLVLFAFAFRAVNPYRDLRNRRALVHQVDHPRLRNVFTSRSRAASVEALLREVERHAQPGDDVLAYGITSTVHYVTRTQPVLESPWPTSLHRNVLSERLAELGSSRPLPVLAVRAMTNTRKATWGVVPLPPVKGVDREKRELIDEALHKLGYRPIWSNDEFRVMKRP